MPPNQVPWRIGPGQPLKSGSENAMQVYQAIVKGLESVGVDAAFGGNGENIASLAVALKHSGIRPIATRHEQAAAYMTRGYAMFTNKLGVCYASVGPGASDLCTGLAVAMSDSYAVLAITGYIRMGWAGRGAVNDTYGLNRTPDDPTSATIRPGDAVNEMPCSTSSPSRSSSTAGPRATPTTPSPLRVSLTWMQCSSK